MKTNTIATLILRTAALPLLLLTACTTDEAVEFGISQDMFEVGADGGVHTVRVSSDTEWIASAQEPWITISPANGRGPAECRILVDSALTAAPRSGLVVIEQQNAERSRQRITVEQAGFDYAITIGEGERDVEIDNFTDYDSRYFELTVTSNVEFDVEIPDSDQNWLSLDTDRSGSLDLNRGIRPRERRLRFNWGINSRPEERLSEIRFVPRDVDASLIKRNDALRVVQKAAERIEENTRRGDSVALLGIQRAMGVWTGVWDSSRPMDEWEGVTLWNEWDERPEGVEPGRVRSAAFYLFATKDPVIPYEVQYLTACEELDFFSNANSFRYSFEDTGEYLPKLAKNLKRLYLDAMGYTDLPASLGELHNLEYLSLMFNNFEKIPAVINGENFPKLHALVMNGNRRNEIMDLSTTVYSGYGGFVEEENALERLFGDFPKLDTLVLGINYLHGRIPAFEGAEFDNDEYRWSEANTPDSLKTRMVNKLWEGVDADGDGVKEVIPRVMPYMRWFTIIGNRYTGSLPVWLLYHPNLDEWVPSQLVFAQEGRTVDGTAAGFDNEPVNMEYYYDFYEDYKTRPADDMLDGDGGGLRLRGAVTYDYEGAARLLRKKGLAPDGRRITD